MSSSLPSLSFDFLSSSLPSLSFDFLSSSLPSSLPSLSLVFILVSE
ncbi:MAG: hypothetical protein M3162_01555 [Thermoproteota archaeon]|nr:hypothetical protein [Thermoproteota archaeon]